MERLSGLDATFLYLETPTHHMHVAMTMVLDPATMPGGYSFDRIKQFIGARLHSVPPFRRRVKEVPFRLHHPIWVEDPTFDLDYHVRRIGAPSPGGRRELAELAGQIASTPLDRAKPLWELWVIEGLKQGRVAVVTKVHHCAIDGASGSELLVHLFDLEPTAPKPEAAVVPVVAERIPNDIEMIGHAALSRMRRNLKILPLLGATAGAVGRVVQGRRSGDGVVGATPLTAPRTPWNGALTPHRSVGLARLSLDRVKAVKNAVDGATVNDVILAVCSGVLRQYLIEHDALPDEPLLAVCPISVRTGDGADDGSANRVSAMFTSLATDIEDPRKRLDAIHDVTKGAKAEHKAVGADLLQKAAEFSAPNIFNLAFRLYSRMGLAGSHRPVHNVIISNVPGPPFPLYYAGAELVAAYPMGPTMEGAGLNITVFSYRDSVDFGFMVCRELIPDVWRISELVEPALEELEAAVGLPAASGATSR